MMLAVRQEATSSATLSFVNPGFFRRFCAARRGSRNPRVRDPGVERRRHARAGND